MGTQVLIKIGILMKK